MLGEAQALLEAAKLTERVAAERAVDLDRHERVALCEQPLADGVERLRAREEQHLEGVRVGAQRLPDGLAGGPVRRAAVGAHEVLGRRDEPLGPREGEREDAAAIDVGVRVREAPRARSDRRIEHDARAERVPGVRAAVREEHLADPARRELAPRVADDADADDGDVEVVAVDLRHAADGPLRDAALADDAVDARHDLGAVRKRDGARVELLEVAQAEVHRGPAYCASGALQRPDHRRAPARSGPALPTSRCSGVGARVNADRVSQYVLFDNSALNYISGQPQHGSQLEEGDRKLLVEVVRGSVAAADTVAVVNIAALGELAGLYFKDRARFDLVRDLLFKDWDVRVLASSESLRPSRVKGASASFAASLRAKRYD